MDEFSFLMVPGLGGSGVDHWQWLWLSDLADGRIVEQADWNRPDIEAWLAVLNQKIAACRKPVVLIAHSLGCALVAHWAERAQRQHAEDPVAQVAAAMLVAPGDVDRDWPEFEVIRPFSPMPLPRFAFPSIVVASTDDYFVTTERSQHFARCWGSEYVSVGPMGHISADSGCGPWPQGKAVLANFLQQQQMPQQ
jgi:hypothetical protein